MSNIKKLLDILLKFNGDALIVKSGEFPKVKKCVRTEAVTRAIDKENIKSQLRVNGFLEEPDPDGQAGINKNIA